MISVKGGSKHLTKKQLWYIQDLCEFIADKFFTKRLKDKLEITVKLSNYLQDEGFLGDCVWEDQHYKPREFTLNVDRESRFAQILNTVAHEMVHVKQMAKGEFYQLMRQPSGIHKFNGRILDQNKIDYWDQPWEIEAHGRAIGLVNQWARDRNFSPAVCDKLILD
jgi:hypothetical protein